MDVSDEGINCKEKFTKLKRSCGVEVREMKVED